MPRGVYPRKKKQGTAASTKPKTKGRTKRFLSDDEKGRIVAFFFSQPGKTYDSWDAVTVEMAGQLGIGVSRKQAERLREAFSLPFDVQGQTDGDAVCEKRLERIEKMLAEIKASVDAWDS